MVIFLEESKKKFVELDVLRVLATLLVVFGHCAHVQFQEGMGHIALNDTPMLHETIYTFAAKVTAWIYGFHMPLFFALSGMCYALNEHTEHSLDKFTWKKFQRLLIPFFLVGTLWMIPVKYIAKFYPDREAFISSERLFLDGSIFGHLWFLLVLFEIFVIFRIFRQYFPNSNNPLIFFSLFCYFLGIPTLYDLMGGKNPVMIAHALTHLIWFVLGYILYKEKDSFQTHLKNYSFAIIMWLGIMILVISLVDFKWHFLPPFFVTLVGCVTIYLFAFCLAKTRITSSSLYAVLLKYSFSIYLFHDPINYLILHAFSKWHWIETFPTLAAATLIGSRTIGICFCAIVVAYILQKSKTFLMDKIADKI